MENEDASWTKQVARDIKNTMRFCSNWEQFKEQMTEQGYFPIIIATKVDKLKRSQIAKHVKMIKEGLVDEVRKLKNMGYDRSYVSMQGLGYKEILDYLDGKYSLDEAIYIIKRETRHFAKRQLTWFRREREVIWLDKSQFDYDETAVLNEMCKQLQSKGMIEE